MCVCGGGVLFSFSFLQCSIFYNEHTSFIIGILVLRGGEQAAHFSTLFSNHNHRDEKKGKAPGNGDPSLPGPLPAPEKPTEPQPRMQMGAEASSLERRGSGAGEGEGASWPPRLPPRPGAGLPGAFPRWPLTQARPGTRCLASR